MSVHFVNTNKAQLTTPASPPAIGSYTVACRVNLDTVSRDHILLVLASGTGNGLARLQLDTGAGKLWALVEANDTNTQFGEASGTTVVAASTWYHVAGTYDGTTMLVYVNGVQEGTFTPTLVTPRAGNWALFQAPASMDGSIADVFACVGALSATQVLRLARERFPFDRPCQYWVPYNNGVSSALNFSGLQASLTITGSPTAGPEAGTPWGTPQQRPILRLLAAPAAIAGNDVETATVLATASSSANDVETAASAAVASATAKDVETAQAAAASVLAGNDVEGASVSATASSAATDVETATLNANALMSGAEVQKASMLATASMLGSDVETGLMTAQGVAAIAGNDVQTASMAAVAALSAKDVETATMTALGFGVMTASDVQTASMLATASMFGADVETASLAAASSGGSGLKAHSYNARRPLTILMRRGTRH